MKIQLVSFAQPKHGTKILYSEDDIVNVIDSSKADVLIFGGGVVKNTSSIMEIADKITNKDSIVLLDSKQNYLDNSGIYIIEKGKSVNLHTHRYSFSTKETMDNVELASSCLDEFFTNRILTLNNKEILLLQGSEFNLFKKAVGELRVRLCLDSLPEAYEEKWNHIYSRIDAIIHICYKPGKATNKRLTKNLMAKDGKSYFGISNIYDLSSRQGNYAAKDGIELYPVEQIKNVSDLWYKSWIYEI